MRHIKFRGRCAITGAWRYGFYYISKGNHIIRDDQDRESIVLSATVGQFTGLHDKNGKEIYEGDILSCVYWEGENCVVKYEQDNRWIGYWFPKDDKDLIEIIGNIHDRKEIKS